MQLQARKPLHLLFQPPQWWTDVNTGSVTCLWATLLQCWYISVDIPYSIWGVCNSSKLAHQLHMYWTDPLATKTLELLLEVMGVFLKWFKLTREGDVEALSTSLTILSMLGCIVFDNFDNSFDDLYVWHQLKS